MGCVESAFTSGNQLANARQVNPYTCGACDRSCRSFFMNRINPEKLLLSKWTSVHVVEKQRHFIVVKLIRASDQTIIACELEAVINKKSCQIKWQALKDSGNWIMGWQ